MDEAFGWVNATDPTTGDIAWRVKTSSIPLGGVVATSGGLVITGETDGTLLGLDAKTGSELYKTQVGGAIGGGIITYEAGGKQLIAIAAGDDRGPTGRTARTRSSFLACHRTAALTASDIRHQEDGSMTFLTVGTSAATCARTTASASNSRHFSR